MRMRKRDSKTPTAAAVIGPHGAGFIVALIGAPLPVVLRARDVRHAAAILAELAAQNAGLRVALDVATGAQRSAMSAELDGRSVAHTVCCNGPAGNHRAAAVRTFPRIAALLSTTGSDTTVIARALLIAASVQEAAA